MIDFDKLRKKVHEGLLNEPSGHNYAHVMRVFRNAVFIAQTESEVEMEVLKAAALLHDIAYSEETHTGEYAERSEELARQILKEKDFSAANIERILSAIRNHDIWVNYDVNVSVETKILRDADRLDHLGHTGIIRAAQYASAAGTNTIKVLEKALTLEREFETAKGAELGKPRLQVMKEFLRNLQAEY